MNDPEVSLLASLASSLVDSYVTDDEIAMWEGSPFYWIKSRPSRQIGAIGEILIAGWAAAKGFDVVKPSNSGHDRIIEGQKVEIKFSTLWTNKRTFTFQQIRDQDYDFALFLGVSPYDAQAWFVPKSELMFDRPPELIPQHGGATGRDTKWLTFVAERPPAWLAPFGGRLEDVSQLIRSAAASC